MMRDPLDDIIDKSDATTDENHTQKDMGVYAILAMSWENTVDVYMPNYSTPFHK